MLGLTETAPFPAELVRAGAAGRLLLVVGPLVALGSGYPSADDVLRELLERAIVEALQHVGTSLGKCDRSLGRRGRFAKRSRF